MKGSFQRIKLKRLLKIVCLFLGVFEKALESDGGAGEWVCVAISRYNTDGGSKASSWGGAKPHLGDVIID